MVLLQGPTRLSSRARKNPKGDVSLSAKQMLFTSPGISVSGQMHPEGLMERSLILHPVLCWGLPAKTGPQQAGASEGRAGLVMGARGL